MNATAKKLNLKAEAKPSAESIELYLANKDNLITILGAVQFDDSLSGDVPLPKDMYVAIRFPGELRSQDVKMIDLSNWITNMLFPKVQNAGPRDPMLNFTATPSKYALFNKVTQ